MVSERRDPGPGRSSPRQRRLSAGTEGGWPRQVWGDHAVGPRDSSRSPTPLKVDHPETCQRSARRASASCMSFITARRPNAFGITSVRRCCSRGKRPSKLSNPARCSSSRGDQEVRGRCGGQVGLRTTVLGSSTPQLAITSVRPARQRGDGLAWQQVGARRALRSPVVESLTLQITRRVCEAVRPAGCGSAIQSPGLRPPVCRKPDPGGG